MSLSLSIPLLQAVGPPSTCYGCRYCQVLKQCRVTFGGADILALKHKSSSSVGWEQPDSDRLSICTSIELIKITLATLQTGSVYFYSIRLPGPGSRAVARKHKHFLPTATFTRSSGEFHMAFPGQPGERIPTACVRSAQGSPPG